MATAALVVSILALLVSLASGVYVRRQAEEQAATRRLEEDRRHDEKRPQFNAWVETLNPTSAVRSHRLCLRLDSPRNLTGLRIGHVAAPGVRFADNQHNIVRDDAGLVNGLIHGQVRPNQDIAWRIVFEKAERPETLRLDLTCFAGDEEWDVPLTVDLPSAASEEENRLLLLVHSLLDQRPAGSSASMEELGCLLGRSEIADLKKMAGRLVKRGLVRWTPVEVAEVGIVTFHIEDLTESGHDLVDWMLR